MIDPSMQGIGPMQPSSYRNASAQSPPGDDKDTSSRPLDDCSHLGDRQHHVQSLKSFAAAAQTIGATAADSLKAAASMLEKGAMGPSIVWQFKTGGSVESSPLRGDDGTVYVTSSDGRLYALKEGRKHWEYDTGGAIHTAPAFGPGGSVIVGNDNGKLVAVRAGEQQWEYTAGKAIMTEAVTGPDGMVYAGSRDGSLVFLRDGEPEYGFFVDDWMQTPLVLQDGTIVVKRRSDLLIAVKYKNGMFGKKCKTPWTVKVGLGIPGSDSGPVAGPGGVIYTGSGDHKLVAAREGKILWEVPTGGAVDSTPCVGKDGIVYSGCNDGKLYAVRDGKTLWTFRTGGEIHSRPCQGPDGTVYVGSDDGSVYALREGQLLWTFTTGGRVRSSPVVDEKGTVYVGSEDGSVYALRTSTMEEQLREEAAEAAEKTSTVEDDGDWIIIDDTKLPKKESRGE